MKHRFPCTGLAFALAIAFAGCSDDSTKPIDIPDGSVLVRGWVSTKEGYLPGARVTIDRYGADTTFVTNSLGQFRGIVREGPLDFSALPDGGLSHWSGELPLPEQQEVRLNLHFALGKVEIQTPPALEDSTLTVDVEHYNHFRSQQFAVTGRAHDGRVSMDLGPIAPGNYTMRLRWGIARLPQPWPFDRTFPVEPGQELNVAYSMSRQPAVVRVHLQPGWSEFSDLEPVIYLLPARSIGSSPLESVESSAFTPTGQDEHPFELMQWSPIDGQLAVSSGPRSSALYDVSAAPGEVVDVDVPFGGMSFQILPHVGDGWLAVYRDDIPVRSAELPSDSRVSFAQLGAGRYRVFVSPYSGADWHAQWYPGVVDSSDAETIVLEADEDRYFGSIQLQRATTIRGTVRDTDGDARGASILLQRLHEGGEPLRKNAPQGTFEFTNVPPGIYGLRACATVDDRSRCVAYPYYNDLEPGAFPIEAGEEVNLELIVTDGFRPTLGACCSTEGCTMTVPVECTASGGEFGGLGSACDSCDQLLGGCCLADGSCVIRTQFECNRRGGAFLGELEPCAVSGCGLENGPCCVPLVECVLVAAEECLRRGGTFGGIGQPCVVPDCFEQVGACCDIRNGSCSIELMRNCDLIRPYGVFLGDGVPCEPSPCLVGTPD